MITQSSGNPERPSPTTWLRGLSDAAWRLLVLAAFVLVFGALLWKLRVVVLPIFISLLICSALVPLVVRLERKGLPPLAAAWIVLFGFLLVFAAVVAVVVVPTAAQSDEIADALSTGVTEVENWLIDGPIGLDRARVEEFTDNPGARLGDAVRSSSKSVMAGVRTAGEVLAGVLLSFILTLLFLKDGRRFQRWVLGHLPDRHHDFARAAGGRAWAALGGYLRGAAILGFVEALIIGTALWAVGSPLFAPVAVFTFAMAFFPVVGAVVAGVVATLVALTAGGPTDALIVLVVVVIVQQLDGDLLAPLIYGRSLQLHPAVILVVLAGGGVVGGIAGAFLAVPVTGAVFGIVSEAWARVGPGWVGRPDGGNLDALDPTSPGNRLSAAISRRARNPG